MATRQHHYFDNDYVAGQVFHLLATDALCNNLVLMRKLHTMEVDGKPQEVITVEAHKAALVQVSMFIRGALAAYQDK